ncbi:hypothetical protein MSHOH_2541 [Methanosarcina horonobensis HB-1 = JCM 15518]|uniref:Uncharacterized protein n=2 Tax=Methanosarcina horonobensis TaxID=418008 RepID=A0A0E3SB59_9EURY|nr:hypothetical protein MSHOH_2541 [Methanosarcina horonobensis HB-1 = JCM 15518]
MMELLCKDGKLMSVEEIKQLRKEEEVENKELEELYDKIIKTFGEGVKHLNYKDKVIYISIHDSSYAGNGYDPYR